MNIYIYPRHIIYLLRNLFLAFIMARMCLAGVWTVTYVSVPLCVGGSTYKTHFEGYKMFRVKVLISCCGFAGIFKLNFTFSVLLCICSSSMFFFCLHTLYLFLSVLIVISGDVVRSAL